MDNAIARTNVDERIPTAAFAADEDGQDLTGLVPDLVGMFIISAEQSLGSRGIAYSTRVDKACSEDQDGTSPASSPDRARSRPT